MSDLILYTSDDGRSQIQLRANGHTVWLTQREMAELFDVSTDNVGLHLKNIYTDTELTRAATTEESSVVKFSVNSCSLKIFLKCKPMVSESFPNNAAICL